MAEMTMAQNMAMTRALAEVHAERRRQHARWGQQDWPDGTGEPTFARQAEIIRANVSRVLASGQLVLWGMLLAEEVAEAMAETDEARLRAELVQVAAVAVQWIEAIDRRRPGA